MSEAKFTPGPLETDFFNVEDSGVYMVMDSLNQAVCECFTQYPFAGKPGITDDEAKGNAFLYAAAPDMYAELDHLKNYFIQPDYRIIFDRIEELLRKARGESEVSE